MMEDSKETRIELNNISKKFNLGFKKNQSALLRFISIFSGKESRKEFWVLKNISFKTKSGENLGIIGKNGSGKSTLLRVIAGIHLPDNGNLKTKGELVYLSGFAQGLNSRLTMRDNIFLVGSIMGLSQKEIKKRFDEIVDFSGLREFLDTKIYQFSSGMIARISFAIGIHCLVHKNPDILLIDEVIGAGADLEYQNKALEKMEKLIKGGACVIFVSHDLESIKKYCDRVIWLDNGEIVKEGKPGEVVEEYRKSIN